jgi:antitoxin CptB
MQSDDIVTRRVRWQCRRGMLELDVMLAKFFENKYVGLPQPQKVLFEKLLTLPDPVLYAWLMGHETAIDDEFTDLIRLIREF